MRKNLTFCLILLVLLLLACHDKRNKPVVKVKVQCDSCCLKKLALFADTLHIDASKFFYIYFNEKSFSLKGCDLKKFRGNASLKSSLVLIWLKIDNVYLKHHWRYSYAQDIGGNSNAAYQIVSEFYFLCTHQDPKWIEFVSPAWVNLLVESDKSLSNNKQIKKLYHENKLLRTGDKRNSNL